MKNLNLYILLACFGLASCSPISNLTENTREFFYPTKNRFEVFEDSDIDKSNSFHFGNPQNYKASYDPHNLFTLRIKENQKYLKLKNGLVSEQPYRHFFADTTHALIDKDILEETYIYIDGLTENKSNGLIIFFNTFPVINSETDTSEYDESQKIFLNYTKSMKTGLWIRKNNDLHIIFNSGKDDVPLKAKLTWYKEDGKKKYINAVNLFEITHPKSIEQKIHKEKMKNLVDTIYQFTIHNEHTSSNLFDIALPPEFIDFIINEYLSSTTLKFKNVFNVNKEKGLPFLVNPVVRTPGIQDGTTFYQWTDFEVLEHHQVVFKTEKFSTPNMKTGIKKKYKYKDKYILNFTNR